MGFEIDGRRVVFTDFYGDEIRFSVSGAYGDRLLLDTLSSVPAMTRNDAREFITYLQRYVDTGSVLPKKQGDDGYNAGDELVTRDGTLCRISGVYEADGERLYSVLGILRSADDMKAAGFRRVRKVE